MTSFIAAVFGGKSPRELAIAMTRTFIQGSLGILVAGPLVLDVSVAAWQAACVGGISAVFALLHGLVQAPRTEVTTTTTTVTSAPVEVTVNTDPAAAAAAIADSVDRMAGRGGA